MKHSSVHARFAFRRTRFPRLLAVLAATAALASAHAPARAQSAGQGGPGDGAAAAPQLEEVVVFGRATQLIGAADAASEGAVGGTDLSVRPLVRVAEMLEVVPGLIAAQHSGSGKANQYFLRGFNLDHGTDFSTYVDGVPWNLRTHGHGQGYLDVNGLLPEVVEEIQYRKGPYRADVGDFSMAASAKISTIDGWDRPFLSLEDGGYGWRRLAAGHTSQVGGGTLSTAGQLKSYDGPWELAEHLRHESVWSKYQRGTSFGELAVSLSGYHATWRPTEQIPERAIGTSVCADEYCALDPTAVGETSRWIASAQLFGDDWDATGYLQYYDWHMLSNPTYDFQIGQFDRRWTLGGQVNRTLIQTAKLELVVGGNTRYDDIGKVGVDHTDGGILVENISDNAVKEASLGAYAEVTWLPTDRLRLLGGLRADVYDFDVTAFTAGSYAGHVTDEQVSPKVGLAYQVSDFMELYGNWGRGFHSNDARGVVNDAAPVPGLAQGTGYEAGARFEVGDVKITAAYWWLNLGSELKFVGDTNAVEPFGGSRRRGYELTAFWRPLDWLGVDASYTGSRARFVDNADGPYIDGSIEHAGELGVSGATGPWEIGARLRYLGPYPLTADNSLRASGETQINLRAGYSFDRVTLYGELLNALGEHGKDIVYNYPAYVAGLDPVGLTSADIDCAVVNCRMSRAEEPRTLRMGVKLEFE
jgi:outer membrane receptor protein involved in Fe transport